MGSELTFLIVGFTSGFIGGLTAAVIGVATEACLAYWLKGGREGWRL